MWPSHQTYVLLDYVLPPPPHGINQSPGRWILFISILCWQTLYTVYFSNVTLWDADRQFCSSWKAELLKSLISGQNCAFYILFCFWAAAGGMNSNVIRWCHSLTASRQRTLSVMENMQAFIYHYVFTWISPSSDFSDLVILWTGYSVTSFMNASLPSHKVLTQ